MRAELLSFLFLFFSLFHRLSSHSLACLFGNIKGISAVFSGGEPSGLWWCFCGSFAELCLSLLCEALLQSNAPEMSLNGEQQCVKKAF